MSFLEFARTTVLWWWRDYTQDPDFDLVEAKHRTAGRRQVKTRFAFAFIACAAVAGGAYAYFD